MRYGKATWITQIPDVIIIYPTIPTESLTGGGKNNALPGDSLMEHSTVGYDPSIRWFGDSRGPRRPLCRSFDLVKWQLEKVRAWGTVGPQGLQGLRGRQGEDRWFVTLQLARQ